MASPTKIYMARVRMKTKNAGRKRKNRLQNRGTTLPWDVFFGDVKKEPTAKEATSR